MKKIIIDADPGVDDFIAISLAILSKKFDILGITTVEGNCSLENATKNTFKILDMCKCNIPVYKGCTNDELGKFNATDVHGNNGLGGIDYGPVDGKVQDMSAKDFLISMVKKYPGEITIVALGPLTNIAECIKNDSEFAKNIGELVVMGGSASYGNITEYAEFNFYKDPYSADIVVKSDIKKISIVGWDITSKMPLSGELEDKFKTSDNELARFIFDISRNAARHDRELYGGAVISDPLTIAYLINPE